MQCDPRFSRLLSDLHRGPLDDGPEVIYGLWPDLTLAYTNRQWRAFAVENGAPEVLDRWPLGTSVGAAFGEALGPFYDRAFRRALATDQPWSHVYACPSPTELRWYSVRVLPLHGQGLLTCHSLVAATPMSTGSLVDGQSDALADAYRNDDGFVKQCSHCRRAQLARDSRIWHFVPAFIERRPTRTSHGLCPLSADYHYREILSFDELRDLIDATLQARGSRQPR